MNASELTFGIEIETTIPVGAVPVGSYTQGVQVPGLPTGWVAKYDGSIRSVRSRQGCEFVSPVLRGLRGMVGLSWLEGLRAKPQADGTVS